MPERNVPRQNLPSPSKDEAFDLLVPIRSADDLMRDDVTEQLEELARSEPERVAKLLRLWIQNKS